MKIGFCCKFMKEDLTSPKEMNSTTTTATFLKKLSRKEKEIKLTEIIEHNLSYLDNITEYLSKEEEILRMFRISSDIFPLYTHEVAKSFWRGKDTQKKLQESLQKIGQKARERNIRLSFHPGQFTVLNSETARVVKNSIEELEYHTDIARFLGYGNKKNDKGFAINIHTGSRAGGLSNFRNNFKKLSKEAKNLLTVENDEFSFGLDEVLKLADIVAIVLDIHHHWINTGEYLQSDDPRLKKISQSWKNSRPKIHYSHTPLNLFEKKPKGLLNFSTLEKNGYKKASLRRHSDLYWNSKANEWALSFLNFADIQCEAKYKNLAAKKLFLEYKKKK